jgi:hypothetical protein
MITTDIHPSPDCPTLGTVTARLQALTSRQRSDFVIWASQQPDPTEGSAWEYHPANPWALCRRGWLARQQHSSRKDPVARVAERLLHAFWHGDFDDRARWRSNGTLYVLDRGEGADAMRMIWMIGEALAAGDRASLRRVTAALSWLA